MDSVLERGERIMEKRQMSIEEGGSPSMQMGPMHITWYTALACI